MLRLSIRATVLFLAIVAYADATGWSKCSKSCGGGTQKNILCHKGGHCVSRRKCNTVPCAKWGKWQPCTQSCGGGHRVKVEKCASMNIDKCPKTYGQCNTHECDPVGQCPPRYQYRYKDASSCCKISTEVCGRASYRSGRIIGGETAVQGQWPWAAALVQYRFLPFCGGSLIHKRWVITAAQCIANPRSGASVLLGSVTILKPVAGHQFIDIDEYLTHSEYVFPHNDIGLIKLKTDVVYTEFVKPVCLPSGEVVPIDAACRVIGWGRASRYSRSNELNEARVKVFPLDTCVRGMHSVNIYNYDNIDASHICAGSLAADPAMCHGDSGSALICQRCSSCGWYLAGIASGNSGRCAVANVPDVFTNVYYFENMIRRMTRSLRMSRYTC